MTDYFFLNSDDVTEPHVEIVSFDAYHYNGGIIAEGKTFPGDIGRKDPLREQLPNRRTIQVRFLQVKGQI